MCLYPTLIRNRRYTANKKNGGNIPPVIDKRTEYVPIGCGDCIECRNKKSREWQVRLMEDIKTNKHAKFIALTFSDKSILELGENTKNIKEAKILPKLKGYERDNAIATVGVRLFLERWRKKYGKSLRHVLITELGHENTENIHLHGIIWTKENRDTIEKIWKYGWIWPKNKEQEAKSYVNNKTVNYIIKYITKQDKDHKYYKPRILATDGIGGNYVKTQNAKYNKYNGTNTRAVYTTNTGHTIALPIYYRNKLYNEEQKEQLWLQTLDKEERWIRGIKIDISKGYKEYNKTLKWYQQQNKELGYGNGQKTWERQQYEEQIRDLKYEERIAKARKDWNKLLLSSRTAQEPACHKKGNKE